MEGRRRTGMSAFAKLFWLYWIGWSVVESVSAQLQNVALNKPTLQSSMRSDGVSERAVDGNKNRYFVGQSCTHTDTEHFPWWQVNLGDIYVIDHILIYNRIDCCSEQTRDISTGLSVDGFIYTQVCYHGGQIPDKYQCDPGSTNLGRLVKITITSANVSILHMCEVEVWSNRTIDRGNFESKAATKGTGFYLETKSVVSDIHCACHCYRNPQCISVNVVKGTSGMTCELLSSYSTESTIDSNITFWKLSGLY